MQVIAAILGYFLVMVIGILIMIFGWGLEPKSWAWIIGGTFASTVVILLMGAITRE